MVMTDTSRLGSRFRAMTRAVRRLPLCPLWTAPKAELLGYAVRTDWPDGSHLIFGWRPTWRAAGRLILRDRRYWRPGPLRPDTWAVVITTRTATRAHPRDDRCRSPDCPLGIRLIPTPPTTPTGQETQPT
jgi:hypothetical protein